METTTERITAERFMEQVFVFRRSKPAATFDVALELGRGDP